MLRFVFVKPDCLLMKNDGVKGHCSCPERKGRNNTSRILDLRIHSRDRREKCGYKVSDGDGDGCPVPFIMTIIQ
ncbi:hypothetical protein NECAME_14381 [Necator americanus]|uniref:Uncharacterized protein n=1 Tax=Necator americanus TaxID=51031 RepID=W2SMZ2_NECAM|nr:hypothetical protein NECAME_14381 [Necator americanus]ETN71059.1 hypothetical protein NECAME_14381 [Necator americanus]